MHARQSEIQKEENLRLFWVRFRPQKIQSRHFMMHVVIVILICFKSQEGRAEDNCQQQSTEQTLATVGLRPINSQRYSETAND